MQIRNYFMLVLIFVSTATYAADSTQMFPSKAECLRQFNSPDAAAGEKFCLNKIVKSAVDLCAEKKLSELKMKNSISSTDELKYVLKFKAECSQRAPVATSAATSVQQTQQSAQEAERSAQIAQQQAALAEQQKQAAAAAAAAAKQKLASGQQQNSMANTANLVVALAPIAEKAFDAMKTAPVGQGAPKVVVAPVGKVEPTPLVGSAGPPSDGVPNVDKDDSARLKNRTKEFNELEAKNALAKDAKDGEIAPGLKTAASDVEKNADGSLFKAEDSVITATAESTSETLKKAIDAAITKATPLLIETQNKAGSAPFDQTEGALRAIKKDIEEYTTAAKKTCTSLAEKTEFLCIEGTSPGAQSVKKYVDIAGPILAVVNSAQKACSSTSKVTGLASTGLAVAKGACVAAKLSCDGLCGVAINDLNKTLTSVSDRISNASNIDSETSMTQYCETHSAWKADDECKKVPVDYKPACNQEEYQRFMALCEAEVNKKKADSKAAATEIVKALNNELVPATPGTSPALAAKCEAKLMDIALFATNIAGLLAAKKGADECDKKLAASGAAGGAVTPTQYCETPANTGTQFCKCKSNSQQEGCPGFAGKGSVVDKDGKPSDIAGPNSKTVGGLSSFAGGTKGSLNPSSGLSDKINSNASNSDDANKLSLSDAVGSSGDGGGGSASGNGNGGRSSGATGGVDGKDNKVAEKKWSFGSFANALGGMFGGGSGGKGSKNSVNGNLNSKQQEAIKRKLASDKLAGEVTSASGKSNWEKIHQVYLIKDNTLLSGQ